MLAPDKKKLVHLKKIVKRYLAWCIIRDEAEARGLAIDQLNEAKNSIAQVDRDVRMKLSQTYAWILSPYIETDDLRTVLWDVYEISCIEGDNIKAAKKRLIDEEALVERWGATLLKMKLDNLFFRDRDSISFGVLNLNSRKPGRRSSPMALPADVCADATAAMAISMYVMTCLSISQPVLVYFGRT